MIKIPRSNWLRCGKDHELIVFVCPSCRMFSTVYRGCRVGKGGLMAASIRCVHYKTGCGFDARLKFEDWKEKNEELYK